MLLMWGMRLLLKQQHCCRLLLVPIPLSCCNPPQQQLPVLGVDLGEVGLPMPVRKQPGLVMEVVPRVQLLPVLMQLLKVLLLEVLVWGEGAVATWVPPLP
jgi:hypothetical protein